VKVKFGSSVFSASSTSARDPEPFPNDSVVVYFFGQRFLGWFSLYVFFCGFYVFLRQNPKKMCCFVLLHTSSRTLIHSGRIVTLAARPQWSAERPVHVALRKRTERESFHGPRPVQSSSVQFSSVRAMSRKFKATAWRLSVFLSVLHVVIPKNSKRLRAATGRQVSGDALFLVTTKHGAYYSSWIAPSWRYDAASIRFVPSVGGPIATLQQDGAAARSRHVDVTNSCIGLICRCSKYLKLIPNLTLTLTKLS